jgi:hypothetical protein
MPCDDEFVLAPAVTVLAGSGYTSSAGPTNGTFRFTRGAPDESSVSGEPSGDEPGAADTPIGVADRPEA